MVALAVRNLSAVIDSQLTELKQVSEKCACLAKAAEAQLRQLEDGHSAQRRVMDSLAPTAALATAWRQRAEDEVLTSDRKRVAGFRRQLDELSPAIAQLQLIGKPDCRAVFPRISNAQRPAIFSRRRVESNLGVLYKPTLLPVSQVHSVF